MTVTVRMTIIISALCEISDPEVRSLCDNIAIYNEWFITETNENNIMLSPLQHGIHTQSNLSTNISITSPAFWNTTTVSQTSILIY